MFYKFLKDLGYDVQRGEMQDYIEQWHSWWKGKVADFHNYRVFNGKSYIDRQRHSMQLPKTVCETWGNLLFNEKCLIAVDDEATNGFVHKVFDDNNFWVKLNEMQEAKSALGTVCYIPYAKGVSIDGMGRIQNAERVSMNYITAENMCVLSHENGIIYEVATQCKYKIQNKDYRYVQLFLKDQEGIYSIQNRLLEESEAGYAEVALESVKGFENLAPIINTGSFLRPFIVDRLNLVNNLCKSSPYGVSVFANAIDQVKLCDIIFDSLANEFILGKRRVMVSTEAIQIHDGLPTYDPRDVVFYQIPKSGTGLDDKPFIKEIDLSLRATEHEQSLNAALNLFTTACGLGVDKFEYTRGGVRTATQVVSENNVMFRTLKKHEIILEAVLVELIQLIIDIGIRVLKQPLNSEAEIKITFDDSIIEDKDALMKRDERLVAQQIMSRMEWRMKWLGETEEQAKEALALVDNELAEPPEDLI